jgi:2,3-bisphosphoglycerate-dependent phosphoglycerate mutase
MITTELVIARHGEAVCNTLGIIGGERGCTGLTPRGRDQAEQLARRLAAEHTRRPFDVLYGTPRRRVRETTEIIARALTLESVEEPELRGLDHGQADGGTWHDAKTAFGGPPHYDPDRPYAPGAESWNAYLERATTMLGAILERHDGQRILISGHGETIQAAHTLLLGLPPETCTRIGFATDHACLARWQHQVNRLEQHLWILAASNDTAHLREATP